LSQDVLARVGQQLIDRVFPDTRDLEQAAFLTQQSDGSLGCYLWPLTTERAASTYHGAVPADTVAIIHTHPHEWLYPSQQDSVLSERLHLPVLVVTHGWIGEVDPAGQVMRFRRLYGNDQLTAPVCQAMTLDEKPAGGFGGLLTVR
jgi:hypothetical protein